MRDAPRLPRRSRPPIARRIAWSLALAAATLIAVTEVAGADAPAVHPERWPSAHSRGIVDPQTEARITALLSVMSLEEKVGQVIQTDISAIEPEDLRRYPLGALLAGGDSGPNGDERATPAEWLKLVREFRACARIRVGDRRGTAGPAGTRRQAPGR
jgi:beta-glucosidase